ncbi:MAG: ATP-binding protein [bacterium]|nr:ATP-binding protein [bacterium]
MIKPNPFTPKSGLEPKVFMNRKDEIELFLERVSRGIRGSIDHFIINGEWGTGKTSLLRYFKLLAQERGNCVACYFLARELDERVTDMEINIHLTQSIVRNIPYDINSKRGNFFKYINGLGIQVLGTGFNISFDVPKERHVDSQIFLMDSLINIWKDISPRANLLVVLIDDVQNYTKVSRIFTTLKNILSDEKIIQETRILFVLSSTVQGWMPFMKENHPIGRFFIPRLELKNFDKRQTITHLSVTLYNNFNSSYTILCSLSDLVPGGAFSFR